MHINWRRGEDRAFVYHRGGGPLCHRGYSKGRADSWADAKREVWAQQRQAERQAMAREEEMPVWKRHIRWDMS